MSLPVYNNLNINPGNVDEIDSILKPDINMRHPVMINLLELEFDQQRETIGLIENYFHSENISFKFPYPVILVTLHEASITRMPVVKRPEHLPKFFSQKEGRINVKEGHVAGKNRLLQQEIRNSDSAAHALELEGYAQVHRQIYQLERERLYLKNILSRLVKANSDG